MDDCLWWMLANPRWLHRMPFDAVWLAIVDPVRALASRTYDIEHKLVLGLKNDFCTWVEGNYEVDASPAGVAVKRTTADADLTMLSSGLSACFLGGAPFTRLERAGRIEARSEAVLHKADQMFGNARAPYCPLLF